MKLKFKTQTYQSAAVQAVVDCFKELATHKPLRAVFRDAGFASDDVKINVEQIFKLLSPSTEVKSI